MSDKSYGQIAYEAYGDERGIPTMSWSELGATQVGRVTQRAWSVAAEAVLDAQTETRDPPRDSDDDN